jgi:uncharacterized membrane protein
MKHKLDSFFFVVAILIFIGARLWHLTSYGLFGDEVFTLWTAQQDWRGLFSSVIGDVAHPPLFYVLLKLWIAIGGESLVWLKLLPLVLSIATVLPFLAFTRELRLPHLARNVALWLMAVNGFLINHAQELRGYSLLLLLSVCSLWLLMKLINLKRGSRAVGSLIALCVVNLLLVFAHYYGLLIVAFELIALAVWKRERLGSFAIGTGLLVLCFSPWLYLVSKVARANPSRINFVWNRPPPVSEVIGYYANLNGPLSYRWKVIGTAIVMIVFLSPIIAWCSRIVKEGRTGRESSSSRFWFLALFAFGPALLAFTASHLLPQSVWAFRYLIIAAPAYFLIAAAAAQRLQRRWIRISLVALIVGWAGVSGFAEMIDRDRVAWEPLVNRMIQAEPQPANAIRIYVTDPNVGNTIQFYLDQAGDNRFQVSFADSFNSLEGEHFWVAFIRYKHELEPLPQSMLASRGLTIGDIIEAEAAGHKGILFPVWKRSGPIRGD